MDLETIKAGLEPVLPNCPMIIMGNELLIAKRQSLDAVAPWLAENAPEFEFIDTPEPWRFAEIRRHT